MASSFSIFIFFMRKKMNLFLSINLYIVITCGSNYGHSSKVILSFGINNSKWPFFTVNIYKIVNIPMIERYNLHKFMYSVVISQEKQPAACCFFLTSHQPMNVLWFMHISQGFLYSFSNNKFYRNPTFMFVLLWYSNYWNYQWKRKTHFLRKKAYYRSTDCLSTKGRQ